MMSERGQVGQFLRNFQQKLKVFDILFLDDRGKNIATLAILEITPNMRRRILASLVIEDYSQGPIGASMHGGASEMWVFGKIVKAEEVYIKITMGVPGSAVICISFHISDYPMKYPFR